MKILFRALFYLSSFYLIVSISGCSSDSSKPKNDEADSIIIRNKSKLSSPIGVKKTNLGDTLKIVVTTSDVTIDSIIVAFQSNVIGKSFTGSLSIPANKVNATGTPRLITKVYLSNGKSEVLYPKFSILPPAPKKISYNLIKTYPHDVTSYTQGLFFKDDLLYESTGQHGTSKLMTVDLITGKPIKSINLDDRFFGEGITYIDNKIYQLTYQKGEAFVYDMDFNKTHTFNYSGEGWGLTTYGDSLLMSNGSDYIFYRDKDSFKTFKQIQVNNHKGSVDELNELELINGFLFANIYRTNEIVKINPVNGAVVGTLDLTNIFPNKASYGSNIDVLNGIAYKNGKLYITGKLWPNLYAIELID